MPSHHQIAAAARIGMLTRERDTASASAQALRELARALPLDAATLLTIDPLTGSHVQARASATPPRPRRPWPGNSSGRPGTATSYGRSCRRPSRRTRRIPRTPDARFRHGWFYAERVRPAGFRDGVTGALRHRGRLVGLVHLSTESADAYDTDAPGCCSPP
ncbi:hypothetical protein SPURM210S_00289 [Streptomyces purpurascens]